MNIVHIAGEAAPFVQTGGLGMVIEKLSAAQARAGNLVRICIPYYLLVSEDAPAASDTGIKINVSAGDREYEFSVYASVVNNVEYLLFSNAELFSRGGIYGTGDFDYSDNDIRYATFSQACLFFLAEGCRSFDVIHCHDWQAGLVPLYSSLIFRDMKWRTVFTVHDINYQGLFQRMDLDELNLPQEVYSIEGLEFYGQISFLKAGLVYADVLTTVSPAYAEDIQSEGFAGGMEGVVKRYANKLRGVLSGIDYNIWNPKADPLIPYPEKLDKSWKQKCKDALAKDFDIDIEKPLFLTIGRMSNRKGIELLIDSAERLATKDANFFVLGHGDKFYARIIKKLPENFSNFFIHLKYDHELAHRLFAAADFILSPSVYEPFGSSHLIGTRYGAVPIIYLAGGAKDTIKVFHQDGTAIVMEEYTVAELLCKIDKAVELYGTEELIEKVSKTAEKADYSWERTAAEYREIYLPFGGGGT